MDCFSLRGTEILTLAHLMDAGLAAHPVLPFPLSQSTSQAHRIAPTAQAGHGP